MYVCLYVCTIEMKVDESDESSLKVCQFVRVLHPIYVCMYICMYVVCVYVFLSSGIAYYSRGECRVKWSGSG
jgi:hypothetical protein